MPEQHILRAAFETNTFGVRNVCVAAIPHVREHGHGTIIKRYFQNWDRADVAGGDLCCKQMCHGKFN
jgi:hypothetical protein